MTPFPVLIATVVLLVACTSRPSDGTAEAPPAKGDVGAGAPNLVGTRWTLVALGSTPVADDATQREPSFTLGGDPERRLTGSGGCNTMFGSYALAGDALSFSGVGATKMACAKGMDVESSFFTALDKVARWRITGQQMELSDSSGTVVARFEARPAP